MVPKCTQIKALAAFWVSTMPPSAILGHGLGLVGPWRPYRKKVRINIGARRGERVYRDQSTHDVELPQNFPTLYGTLNKSMPSL